MRLSLLRQQNHVAYSLTVMGRTVVLEDRLRGELEQLASSCHVQTGVLVGQVSDSELQSHFIYVDVVLL